MSVTSVRSRGLPDLPASSSPRGSRPRLTGSDCCCLDTAGISSQNSPPALARLGGDSPIGSIVWGCSLVLARSRSHAACLRRCQLHEVLLTPWLPSSRSATPAVRSASFALLRRLICHARDLLLLHAKKQRDRSGWRESNPRDQFGRLRLCH